MDDLIASLSGTVHVSQEAYDLEAVKAHFARTLVLPVLPIPLSPVSPSRPLPGSRSQSRTRPPPMHFDTGAHQPFPSPALVFQPAADASMSMLTPSGRPNPTRTGSYGFAHLPAPGAQTQSEPSSPSALEYEADTFAPMWTDDAWAPAAAAPPPKSPWAAFGGPGASNAFAGYEPYPSEFEQRKPFAQTSAHPAFAAPPYYTQQPPQQSYAPATIGFDAARCQAPPSPPMDEEDESMDEDIALDSVEAELDDASADAAGGGHASMWTRGRW
ncbi:hypothetical protein Q5752_003538 [Cryptotrichosporon argae]